MPAVDRQAGRTTSGESPASSAFAITTHNTNELTTVTRGVYVGVSGDLKVDMLDGTTVTFANIVAGVIHPLRVRKVYATGTTATNIIGLY